VQAGPILVKQDDKFFLAATSSRSRPAKKGGDAPNQRIPTIPPLRDIGGRTIRRRICSYAIRKQDHAKKAATWHVFGYSRTGAYIMMAACLLWLAFVAGSRERIEQRISDFRLGSRETRWRTDRTFFARCARCRIALASRHDPMLDAVPLARVLRTCRLQ